MGFCPVADYKVTGRGVNGRGVYSFCMCPGGQVVNASSGGRTPGGERDEQSRQRRKKCQFRADRGGEPFRLSGRGAACGDRFSERTGAAGRSFPAREGFRYSSSETLRRTAGVRRIGVCCRITVVETASPISGRYFRRRSSVADPRHGAFGGRIPGFDRPDVIFSGVESRTSSPVRIERDEHYESPVRGLFPCGEGAGYAGGITSAAVDGIKIAEEIMRRFRSWT